MTPKEESIISLRLLNLENTVKDYEEVIRILLRGMSHSRSCACINGGANDACSCGLSKFLRKFNVS